MQLLITGGIGYIGSHTIVELYAQGHACVILDNLSNTDQSVHQALQTITGQDIPLVIGDCREGATLEQLFDNHHIDAVIHFAARKAVGESCQHPFLYYDNNITGTITLLQTMQRHDINTLLFSSSATVYDATQSSAPFAEDAPIGNCSNPYGTTKYVMESIIRDYCLHQGFRAISLRYFNPLGAHHSGLLGEVPHGIPNNLFPYLFQVATGQRDQVIVFGADRPTRDGTGERDYISIQDLSSGHLAALTYLQNQKTGHYDVYNLGTSQGTTVLEAIALIQQVTKQNIPYTINHRRPGDIAISIANATKANEHLGRSATTPLIITLAHARNFYQNQH